MIGFGVGGGIWCLCQAVWAIFLLANAKKILTTHAYLPAQDRRAPIARNLLCNVTAFTTFAAFTSASLIPAGTLSLFFNGGYGIGVGVLLFCMSAASFVAAVVGCCVTCTAGCGCICCDHAPCTTPHGYQKLVPNAPVVASIPGVGTGSTVEGNPTGYCTTLPVTGHVSSHAPTPRPCSDQPIELMCLVGDEPAAKCLDPEENIPDMALASTGDVHIVNV